MGLCEPGRVLSVWKALPECGMTRRSYLCVAPCIL